MDNESLTLAEGQKHGQAAEQKPVPDQARPSDTPPACLSLAVLSGKGGVGKTSLTLNLALALEEAGAKTLVVDGDLGLANIDVLLGIAPDGSLQDFLLGRARLEDLVVRVSPGLDVLPAASGAEDLVTVTQASRGLLADSLAPHLAGYGFVFLDLGAGIAANVRELSALARMKLVVTTPEPTALTDCYALMKVLNASQGTTDFACIVNSVQEEGEEAFTVQRLGGACSRFLGFEPRFLGAVRQDPAVAKAVCLREPLLRSFPESGATKDIRAIARRLLAERARMQMQGLLDPPLVLPDDSPQADRAALLAKKPS